MSVSDGVVDGWAPVVYGRTSYADTWWRAVPEGVQHMTWLRSQVSAVVSGGAELRGQPRFLLAQDGAVRLVGTAVNVIDISETMALHGGRELYCFVGWLARATGAGLPPPPRFTDLRTHYRDWAGAIYERIVGPVWDTPAHLLQNPQRTLPQAPPWDRMPADGAVLPLPPAARVPDTWPASGWDYLWSATGQSRAELTCVLGWSRTATADSSGVTHLGVADAPQRPVPPPPAPEPRPAPRPTSTAERREPFDWRTPESVPERQLYHAPRRGRSTGPARAVAYALAALAIGAIGFIAGRATAPSPTPVPTPAPSSSPAHSSSPAQQTSATPATSTPSSH